MQVFVSVVDDEPYTLRVTVDIATAPQALTSLSFQVFILDEPFLPAWTPRCTYSGHSSLVRSIPVAGGLKLGLFVHPDESRMHLSYFLLDILEYYDISHWDEPGLRHGGARCCPTSHKGRSFMGRISDTGRGTFFVTHAHSDELYECNMCGVKLRHICVEQYPLCAVVQDDVIAVACESSVHFFDYLRDRRAYW